MQRVCALSAHRVVASRLCAAPSTAFPAAAAGLALPLCGQSKWDRRPALYTPHRFASSSASAAPPPQQQRNFYRILGVDTDATPAEVKAAYRQLALRYHPDVADDAHRGQAEMLFRRVSEAYEVLSDPVKRRAHDGELGVQTRRKQPTAAAATAGAAAPSGAAAAAGRGSRRASGAAASQGTASDHGRRKRRSSTSASAQSSGAAAAGAARQQPRRYRKPFVRGDANRVFADAFDGKTLDEILFDVQRRRRQAAAPSRASTPDPASTAAADASSSAASSSLSLEERALSRDARLRHVMEDAAESFARKAQRQYGHGILRHIRAAASALPDGPAAPPESYMPFRPFVGMDVPAGVRTPPEPQMAPVLSPDQAAVEAAKEAGEAAPWRHEGEVPAQFHTHHYADGDAHSRLESLRKATQNVEGMPYNMGQLYSYHRPY